MKNLSKAIIIGLLLSATNSHKLEEYRITDETARDINDAVSDVLHITQDEPRVRVNHAEEHHSYDHVVVPGYHNYGYDEPVHAVLSNPLVAAGPRIVNPYYTSPSAAHYDRVVQPVYQPVIKPVVQPVVQRVIAQPVYNGAYGPLTQPFDAPKREYVSGGASAVVTEEKKESTAVPPAKQPDTPSPNSSVMRAIADANEQSSMDKVHQQREVADKMERLEHQSTINDAINDSVKKEEQRVIEAANRRMAEVHARKAEEANSASQAIEQAKKEKYQAVDSAESREKQAIRKIASEHASNVIS